jgi:hypothetical protein
MDRLVNALLAGDGLYFWTNKGEYSDFAILQNIANRSDLPIALKAQIVLAHASCKHFINLQLEAEAIYMEVLSAQFN